MLAKFKKLNLRSRFTLRTALTAALTIALVVSATVFMAVSAANNVTPSDVSPSSLQAVTRKKCPPRTFPPVMRLYLRKLYL